MAIIVIGKSLAAFALVRAFRYPVRTALTISASLAQIGEFSFILAGLGVTLGLLPPEGRDLILAGALLSITLNPLTFAIIDPMLAALHARPRMAALLEPSTRPRLMLNGETTHGLSLRDHAIVVGYGRVGGAIGPALQREGLPFVVIERDRRVLDRLRSQGVTAVYGDATAQTVLAAASVTTARMLVIAVPDGFQGRRILELTRNANPRIHVIARSHSQTERAHLERLGVYRVVMGELELALGMLAHTLTGFGVENERARVIVEEARRPAERIRSG